MVILSMTIVDYILKDFAIILEQLMVVLQNDFL